jgi:hypothetical protein
MQLHFALTVLVSLWLVGLPTMYCVAVLADVGFVGIWY